MMDFFQHLILVNNSLENQFLLFDYRLDYDQEQTTTSSRRTTSSSSNHQRSNSGKGVRFNDDVIGRSLQNLNHELQSLSNEHGRLKHEIGKTSSSSKQHKELLNLLVQSLIFNDEIRLFC